MTITNFITDNKISLTAMAVGGAIVAAGMALYSNVEINRPSVRLFYDQQLNAIREELANLQSEMCLLRMMMKTCSEKDHLKVKQVSFDGLRTVVNNEKQKLDVANGLARVPSVQSLSSDGEFMDALDTLETTAQDFLGKQLVEFLSKVDDLNKAPNNQHIVYDQLKQMYECDDSHQTNVELLWRLARSCHALANTYDQKNPRKKAILLEGRSYAKQAYNLDENNFEALRWVAVLTGSVTDFLGTQEKIKQGYLFKHYLDKAIAIQPTEYTLLHMRGRFAFSVANLSWLERKAAAALFSALPQATIDEALQDFLAVERLKPSCWIENLYYLVQCLLAKKEKTRAIKYIKIAQQIIPIDDSEKQMLDDMRKLLAKYS